MSRIFTALNGVRFREIAAHKVPIGMRVLLPEGDQVTVTGNEPFGNRMNRITYSTGRVDELRFWHPVSQVVQ